MPIITSSPLVKLLEARLLKRLNNYLIEEMFSGQIEFVPGCGVLLNLTHAADTSQRVRLQENNNIFGIFIDFANAFNTINHALLFERIVPVL